ncbi:MAG: hypothetical protein P4M05_33645 [Bradyrhizobium sp.]|nr:hypothetical protein [Bradyrhizobium sp.]
MKRLNFLMAAAGACLDLMVTPSRAQSVMPIQMGTSVPISLDCPNDAQNILTITYRTNDAPTLAKLQVYYTNGLPARVMLLSAKIGGSYKALRDVTSTDNDERGLQFFRRMVAMVAPVNAEICGKPGTVRERYLAALSANKAQLQAQKPD